MPETLLKKKFSTRLLVLFLTVANLPVAQCFAQPSIRHISSVSATAGSSITLKGNNFDPSPDKNTVRFGSTIATISSATDTALIVTVPVGAVHAQITVTTNGLTGYSTQKFSLRFAHSEQNFKQSSFYEPLFITTGTSASPNPWDIAAVDFDNDGKTDLFVSNLATNEGSVLRNTSSGYNVSFAPIQHVNLGTGPQHVATGDLDGDGLIDVAAANFNSGNDGTVSVLKNISTSGQINFESIGNFPSGQGSSNVSIADINGDGKPDLIVASGNSGIISFFRNITAKGGPISFAPKTDITAFFHPQGMELTDIDGDMKPDLLLANFGDSTISVLQNSSDVNGISFIPTARYKTGIAFLNSLDVADVDLDGKMDIVAVGYNSTSAVILKNTTTFNTISFTNAGLLPVGGRARSLSVSDVNGDGRPDLLVVHIDPDSATAILKNVTANGTLSFAQPVLYQFAIGPSQIVGADLTGDNKPELISTSHYQSITIQQNRFDQPILTSFTPNATYEDSVIKISGENLTTASAVFVGNKPVKQFQVISDSLIIASVGNGASGHVKVHTSYGTDSIPGFVFIEPLPALYSFSPQAGSTGAFVTLTGKHFNRLTAVSFGGIPATSFQVVNDSIATAVVGSGGTGYVMVRNPAGADSLANFLFAPPHELLVYPNPAQNSTVMVHPYSSSQALLQLIDMNGKVTLSKQIAPHTPNTTISLGGVRAGIYKLVWSDGSQKIHKTIIVQ